MGVALRDALDRQRRLGAEAEHARVSRGLAAERAAAAERRRISAELHDALAHALGALVVQASVAGDLVRRDPAAAPGALQGVAQGGREALGETGRLLRLLRDDRDELGLRLAAAPEPEAERGRDPAAPVASARSIQHADLLLPALFGVIGTAELVWYGAAPLWAAVGVHWLAVGVLCARRALPLAMPVAVAGIVAGGQLLGVPSDEPSAVLLAIALACFSAGLHVPHSRAAAGLASVLVAFGLSVMVNAVEAQPRRGSPSSPAAMGWSACASACRCSGARFTPARLRTAASTSWPRCRWT
jgi:hypothetical protein